MAGQIDSVFDVSLFEHHSTVQVRFADLDVLGHVNHTKYLTYMEQGRIAYAADVWGWSGQMEELGMIVARMEVDYIAPLFLNDTVNVWTRIARLGTKSFDFLYVMTRSGQASPQIVATGKSAMVAYDYATGKTIPINVTWRETTRAFEKNLSST